MKVNKLAIFAVMCFAYPALLYKFYSELLIFNLDKISYPTTSSWMHRTKETQTLAADLNDEKQPSVYIKHHLKSTEGSSIANSSYYKILWWTAAVWLFVRRGPRPCKTSSCEYSNCILTTDKQQLNKSSAVVISVVNRHFDYMSHISRSMSGNPDQVWIFFARETPITYRRQKLEDKVWRNVFNWSMTYRRDADIFVPYGYLQKRTDIPYKNYIDIFRKKTKHVAWIVSNCVTNSLREKYKEQLQKYVPVDVYGRCGSQLTKEDLHRIPRDYKFYLGFENAFCKDYVTEKFFHYFQYDMIVVVRGLFEYDKHLPKDTFINAANFPSIKALGQFLERLGHNEQEYIKYLKTKDKFTAIPVQKAFCESICTICEKLNNLKDNRRTYRNIMDWVGYCERPKDLQ